MIELCDFYTTTGFPAFKPKCLKGRRASLKCHKRECKCPEYKVTEKEVRMDKKVVCRQCKREMKEEEKVYQIIEGYVRKANSAELDHGLGFECQECFEKRNKVEGGNMTKVFVSINIDSEGKFSNVEVSGENVKAVVRAVKVMSQEFMPEVEELKFPFVGKVITKKSK